MQDDIKIQFLAVRGRYTENHRKKGLEDKNNVEDNPFADEAINSFDTLVENMSDVE